MDLIELAHGLMRRTSQFGMGDWLTTFSCILVLAYVLLLNRRSVGFRH